MRSFRISYNQRAASVFAAAALVFATLIPSLAAAETVSERSIAMSSSVAGAASVYNVSFKAQTDGTGAFALDFCTTPDIGTACTAPTAMAIGTIGTTSAHTVTKVANNSVKVVLGAPVDTDDVVTVDISGITNTSTVGVFYARIVTYEDGTVGGGGHYNYTAANSLGAHLDEGTVAMAATSGFSLDGKVLETLTFCVSGTDESDCTAPHAVDGQLGTNGILAETAGSDVDVHTFIATNASSGAVVNLKSDALGCGGLYRDGVSDEAHCGIAPITTAATLANGDSKFGAKLALTQPTGGDLVAAAGWSASLYYMPYVDEDAGGVTSVYGAEVYNTKNAPSNFGKGKLSFNANRSNLTPAGSYKANFSLIATGKF